MKEKKCIKLLNYIICIWIFTNILPAGRILSIPAQKICMGVLMILGITILFYRGNILSIIKELKLDITIIIIGGIWAVVSYMLNCEYSIKFAGLLFASVIIFLLLFELLQNEILDKEKVYKAIFIMIILKIVFKVIIEVIFVCKLVGYDELCRIYTAIFNTDPTMMTMHFAGIKMVRVQNASDIITISLLPFYVIDENNHFMKKICCILVLGIYSLIVFSRIYILEYLCFILMIVIIYRKKIPMKAKMIGGGAFLLSGIVWIRPVFNMVKYRFFSSEAVESDAVRNIQINGLLKGILDKPLWGHGMGSYMPDIIRSDSLPFTYEAEYLALLYQLGFIGFVVLIIGVLSIYIRKMFIYLRKATVETKLLAVVCIGWMIVRPMFNPSLLGLQNGFPMIGVLLIGAYQVQKQE